MDKNDRVHSKGHTSQAKAKRSRKRAFSTWVVSRMYDRNVEHTSLRLITGNGLGFDRFLPPSAVAHGPAIASAPIVGHGGISIAGLTS